MDLTETMEVDSEQAKPQENGHSEAAEVVMENKADVEPVASSPSPGGEAVVADEQPKMEEEPVAVAEPKPEPEPEPTPAPRPLANIAPSSAISAANIPMPFLQQTGEVYVGPGAVKEACLVGLGLKKLRSRDKDRLYDAKRYAMDVSIKQIMLRQQQIHQQNQQKQQMYAQALSLMARVYVGSISFEIREENLRKAMEPFGPIKSLNMSWDTGSGHHKGFAFLEYEVPEAATLAQDAMNGLLMGGRNLKVLPTRLFNQNQGTPQAQPIIDMVMQEAKKYYRVYVASVHPDISENELKSVFEAFGEVISCKLARNANRAGHRGFGYIEFNNINSMNEAIAGMNQFDLGGQYLRVGRCVTPPEALNYIVPSTPSALPQSAAMALAAVTAKVQALEATKGRDGSSSPGGGSPKLVISATAADARRRIGNAAEARNAAAAAKQLAISAGPATPPPPVPVPVVVPEVKSEPSPAPANDDAMDIDSDDEAKPEPATLMPPPPQPEFKVPQLPKPAIPPPGLVTTLSAPGVVVPKLSSAPLSKPKKEKKSLLDRIKLNNFDASAKASFGPSDDYLAKEEEEAPEETNLMITSGRSASDVQSLALSLIEGPGALEKVQKEKAKKEREEAYKKAAKQTAKAARRVKSSKSKKPSLNTEAALAAAEKAGAMSDQILTKEANSEEATLASEEGREIRGNESRHLLMTKLMRINRSPVLVLKNMVGPEDIDDYLEGEVKEECSKYGEVEEVLIVNDEVNTVVKIFVKFLEAAQADEGRKALDGRFFGGRTVSAAIYDQVLYDHGDFTG